MVRVKRALFLLIQVIFVVLIITSAGSIWSFKIILDN